MTVTVERDYFYKQLQLVILETQKWAKIEQLNKLPRDISGRSLDLYCAEYEHFIIVRDFNTEVTQASMKVFFGSYGFIKNLIEDATCYKNPENPSCIDLILTNNPNSF